MLIRNCPRPRGAILAGLCFLALVALVAALVAGCGSSSTATPPSTPSPTVSGSPGDGNSMWTATNAELAQGVAVTKQFVAAVGAKDLATARKLMAPDASFKLSGVTNQTMRMTWTAQPSPVFITTQENFSPHLELGGSGFVKLVASPESYVPNLVMRFIVELRRDAAGKPWRVWNFTMR
jgi:hypothetical protein